MRHSCQLTSAHQSRWRLAMSGSIFCSRVRPAMTKNVPLKPNSFSNGTAISKCSRLPSSNVNETVALLLLGNIIESTREDFGVSGNQEILFDPAPAVFAKLLS